MAIKPRLNKWRGYGVNLLLFVVLIFGIRSWQQRDMVSGAAPALQGVTLTGLPYNLSVHPAQAVLVHFWASWCPICRAEQRVIDAIAQEHPNVITIAMQSGNQHEVRLYLREKGLTFSVLNDPDGTIASRWGVHAVPVSFIVSPDGKIRFVEVGYTTGMGIRLRLWWAEF